MFSKVFRISAYRLEFYYLCKTGWTLQLHRVLMSTRILRHVCCVAVLGIAPFSLIQAKPLGTLHTVRGAYDFAPIACAIYKDGDFYDIEVHGPGTSPDGEKVYVEFSSTAEALDMSFGVDSVFASSDKKLQSAGPLQISVDGSKIKVVKIKLVDQDRQVVDANATLSIDCSRD